MATVSGCWMCFGLIPVVSFELNYDGLSRSTVDIKVKRPKAPVEIPLEPRSVHDEFSIFKPPEGEAKIRTSPQLLLATHRFLSRGLSALM